MARRLIKLVEEVLVNSTRHAAHVCSGRAPSSVRQPADLHPLPWRLALLTTALRAMRSPRLNSMAKKAAWHLALRCARVALLDLQRPPARTPPEDARALEEVIVREQRLSLACVQPLALRAVAGGMSADAVGTSATSDATGTDSSTASSEEMVADGLPHCMQVPMGLPLPKRWWLIASLIACRCRWACLFRRDGGVH